MAWWKRVDNGPTEFAYHLFLSSAEVTIELDDGLLQKLVELFVGVQLKFWRHINRLAKTRFPDKQVNQNNIQKVREFIQSRSDEFIRLFTEYIPYYLMLNFPPSHDALTQKHPHLRPNEQYADHLAVWRTPMGNYQLMVSEAKTSEKKPRDRVRRSSSAAKGKGRRSKSMFDEFDEIEKGQHDPFINWQLLYQVDWSPLLVSEEEFEKLVEAGFWKRDFIYHGCVVTSESKACPSIFNDYSEVAAKEPDSPWRRWATVVPISTWENWVDKITKIALDFLAEREAEGHF
jgi:hypothetical protein